MGVSRHLKASSLKRLVVLGAGTAGTMVANRLDKRLANRGWAITVVDPSPVHHYQPGYLFVPFGTYQPDEVVKPTARFIPDGVELVTRPAERIEPNENTVILEGGETIGYDQLVIATGSHPRPDQTPGMLGSEWRKSVHDFYSFEGSVALAEALEHWKGGRLVVHVTETPIKCPVAPLEFAFLAEAHFRRRNMRDQVEIVYVTPLDGAFTKPIASQRLGGMLEDRRIGLETDFMVERVDPDARTLVSYDERVIPFDLLVTVPLNMGADVVGRSGLGNELNFVPVDKHTLQSKAHDNIFALGDAADLPTSKAGSTAHFSVELWTDNFVRHIDGKPMESSYDGHANCFVESGDRKGMLIDFNYDTEPLPGKYPVPRIGPFSLLRETTLNHYGKLMFKWMYWHVLLRGRPLPMPARMSMAGKEKIAD